MVSLSRETEALARRLADAQRMSVEDVIRRALEASARAASIGSEARRPRDGSPEAVAGRQARFDEFADRIAAAPINDPRPVGEIVDDLNAL